uniref:Uncharacterized protein n=1 Tax=Rhizophora mucronata TaxID=61149 RepID=A0A2P2Q991_RHIMU
MFTKGCVRSCKCCRRPNRGKGSRCLLRLGN